MQVSRGFAGICSKGGADVVLLLLGAWCPDQQLVLEEDPGLVGVGGSTLQLFSLA